MSVFIDNEYTRNYFAIIHSAKTNLLNKDTYTERHHIIPCCFFKNNPRTKNNAKSTGWIEGDPNDPENIVVLTYQQHIECHILLPNMVTKNSPAYHKMLSALKYMLSSKKLHHMTNEQQVTCRSLSREASWELSAQRMQDGTHHFLNPECRKSATKKALERGNHPFQNKKLQKELSMRSMGDKTHVFYGGEQQRELSKKRIADGTHNMLIQHTCPWCGKVGKSIVMHRHHYDNCPQNPDYVPKPVLKDDKGRLLKKDGTLQKKRGPKPSKN